MKKTAAIVTGCVALALIWASRPDNPSDTTATPQDAASARLTHASSSSRPGSGAFRRAQETTQPESDGPPSVSEESQRQIVDEPAEAATNGAEAFWAFALQHVPLPETQEPGMTLDRFDRPYTMTMTEAGFAQLSPADKSVAVDEIVDSLRQARRDARDTCAQADAEIAHGNYDRAEIALVSECERLDAFNANEEGLYLTRIMGISFQQTALKKLETLYTRTGNHLRLQTTQQRWQELEAQKRQMQAAQMEQAI